MSRNEDVIMVFDFLVELLKSKQEKTEPVPELKNIVEEPKVSQVLIDDEKNDEIPFNLGETLRHAAMLIKRVEAKDKENASTQNLLATQRKEYEAEIKKLKSIHIEKSIIEREEESDNFLATNIPTGEFTGLLPRLEILDENNEEKPVSLEN
jgi:hypothetical protein